jgi:hypothetical protein
VRPASSASEGARSNIRTSPAERAFRTSLPSSTARHSAHARCCADDFCRGSWRAAFHWPPTPAAARTATAGCNIHIGFHRNLWPGSTNEQGCLAWKERFRPGPRLGPWVPKGSGLAGVGSRRSVSAMTCAALLITTACGLDVNRQIRRDQRLTPERC